jgi:hypothetical protein
MAGYSLRVWIYYQPEVLEALPAGVRPGPSPAKQGCEAKMLKQVFGLPPSVQKHLPPGYYGFAILPWSYEEPFDERSMPAPTDLVKPTLFMLFTQEV